MRKVLIVADPRAGMRDDVVRSSHLQQSQPGEGRRMSWGNSTGASNPQQVIALSWWKCRTLWALQDSHLAHTWGRGGTLKGQLSRVQEGKEESGKEGLEGYPGSNLHRHESKQRV